MAKEKSKRKSRIDSFDARLFGSLHHARRPLSIKKLAQRTDMSWQTANKHLKKLQELDIIDFKKTVKKTSVFITPRLMKIMDRDFPRKKKK
jgi:DNA-binding transcriptional regulator GbsR (MarR family)